MKDLSIVIVNYNTKQLCEQSIQAVRRSTHIIDVEIIVVDNSSDPGERYISNDKDVLIFSDIENKGFGHACNMGANRADGRIFLFLNSDTIVSDGALDRSVEYLNSHPEVGALGIKTLLADGGFDHGCKRGFPTPMNSLYYFLGLDRRYPENKKFGGYRLTYLDENQTHRVDSVSGAFLMVPRLVFSQVQGFDENFFMYGEDVDLCCRIKQERYEVVYYSEAEMLHLRGQSGMYTQNPSLLFHFYNAMTLFYDKHYKRKYPFLTTCLVHAAIRMKYRLALRKLRSIYG